MEININNYHVSPELSATDNIQLCFSSTLSLSERPALLDAWQHGFKFLANRVMKLESIEREFIIYNINNILILCDIYTITQYC